MLLIGALTACQPAVTEAPAAEEPAEEVAPAAEEAAPVEEAAPAEENAPTQAVEPTAEPEAGPVPGGKVTIVFPEPTSPWIKRFIGKPETRSSRISSTTLLCALVKL